VVCVSSLAILGQFHKRLAALTRIPIAIDQAHRHAGKERVVVASVASLRGRLDNYQPSTLLILDEAHHANADALATLETAKHFDHVLSLTASPWSDGVVEQLGRSQTLFLRYSEAASKGLCAPYELLQWTPPAGPFGLMFCKTNQAAKQAATALRGASWVGIDSGEVPTRITRWRSGQLGVLCANRMLWEGFDEPRCANVWLDRDTESEIALVQMAGRALRHHPGKTARIYTRTPEQQLRLALAMLRLEIPPGQAQRR
jgi:superfamily II DNA or RNA helicase